MLKRKSSSFANKKTPPGSAPGLLVLNECSNQPKIFVTSYNETQLIEQPLNNCNEIANHIQLHADKVNLIEVRGLADKSLLESLCDLFDIHRLAMEDVVNTYQRPKLEEHHSHLFVISRVFKRNGYNALLNEQVAFFLGKNYVLVMQDAYDDFFEPVRARIRMGKGNLRSAKVGYLAYCLLDGIVDTYFPILESTGESLDELEDTLFNKPSNQSLQKIQNIKRELIIFRRTIFAERDKINDLMRTATVFFDEQTKMYLRDTYDHTIQVMDLVESHKEITASLMDIYLSSVSNKMNGIMKVLAVISTIFIPLTFIVGVYGMNFAEKDPVTGADMQYNMPELYSPYGYIGVMIFMLIVVVVQLLIFWRKGWLEKN